MKKKKTGSTADNDLDLGSNRIGNGDAKYPIEFKITGVNQQPQRTAHLLVRAYDVDEYDGSSGTGEWDRVYLSSNPADIQLGSPYTEWPTGGKWANATTAWKKEFKETNYIGALSGNDEKWNTTVFTIDPALITAANTEYFVGVSTHHYFKAPASTFNSGWIVDVDWGQLVLDGGPKQSAELIPSTMKVVNGKMVVDTGFIPKTAGHFDMEVSLIEKVTDPDGTVSELNLATEQKRFVNAAQGEEKPWTNIQLGSNLDPNKEYTVNIILFDDRGRNLGSSDIDPGKAQQIYLASSLKDIEKIGPQYTPTPFSADDFKDKYSKLDNSSTPNLLQQVKILTLPDAARGTLVLDNGTDPATEVTAGQEIPVAELDQLKFVPAPDTGFTGNATFKWTGSDGISYALFDGNVTITANKAPTVDHIVKEVNKGSDVVFTGNDFTAKYSDPENNALNEVTIWTLPDPDLGKLVLGVTDVTYGMKIPAASLGQLRFVVNEGKTGTTIFDWNGSDGVQYAQQYKTATIRINNPPVVRDVTKTGLTGAVIPFSEADFANAPAYTDTDHDALHSVTITLPSTFASQGTLSYKTVTGTTYTVIQPGTSKTLSAAELNSLTFKPSAGLPSGSTVTFQWIGNDGKANAETPALVNIAYNGIPVADPIAISEQEGNTPITIVLQGYDMETVTGLVYGIKTQPSKGTLTLAPGDNAGGSRWVYTPNAGFTGTDSFTYTVTDAQGQESQPATVSIKIHKALDGWAGSKNQGDDSLVKVIPGQLL